MSNNFRINENKNEIEIEKSSIIKNNYPSPISEIRKNKELKNQNYIQEYNYTNENLENKFKSINSQRNKIQINYKKLNSFNFTGCHTLKKEQIKLSTNSEQERYNRIKKKLYEHNNNMNQRVNIFVPSEEYLELLEEIDAENNSENNDIVINNNSEEVKLDNHFMNSNFEITNKDVKINMENKSDDISSMNDDKNGKKNNLFSIKKLLKEKRELKFDKDFDINFDIFLTEVYFKYGAYSININKYNKCFLLLRKCYLYVFNQNSYNSDDFKST